MQARIQHKTRHYILITKVHFYKLQYTKNKTTCYEYLNIYVILNANELIHLNSIGVLILQRNLV